MGPSLSWAENRRPIIGNKKGNYWSKMGSYLNGWKIVQPFLILYPVFIVLFLFSSCIFENGRLKNRNGAG
jgi:hypothetical protein